MWALIFAVDSFLVVDPPGRCWPFAGWLRCCVGTSWWIRVGHDMGNGNRSKKQMGPGISPWFDHFFAGNLAGLIASINDNHRGKTGENWSWYIPLDFLSSRFPTWDHRCSPALTVRGLFGTSLKMHSKAHTVIPTYTILYYIILYFIILYYILLYYIILLYVILYYIIICYFIILYYIILNYIVFYFTLLIYRSWTPMNYKIIDQHSSIFIEFSFHRLSKSQLDGIIFIAVAGIIPENSLRKTHQ